jgi:hypothetical protein
VGAHRIGSGAPSRDQERTDGTDAVAARQMIHRRENTSPIIGLEIPYQPVNP